MVKSTPPPPPRTVSASRQAKVTSRRQQIAALAMEMMRERGYNAFSVNELAERAGMSIGGLYRYIKTKSDLLEIICDQINEGLHQRMLAAAPATGTHEERLKSAYRVYWDTVWDSDEPVLMAIREWQSLPADARQRYFEQESTTYAVLEELMAAGAAAGEFNAVNTRLLASTMVYLAQMRALKGWSFKRAGRAAVFNEHWEMIRGRLTTGAKPAARGTRKR